ALLRAAADAATAANEEEQSPAETDGAKMLCKVPILPRGSLGSPACLLTVAQRDSASFKRDAMRWGDKRRQRMTPYNTDVYARSQEQAALLDGKQWDTLDIANLIEEILSVGASQYTAVSSAVYQILVHLLKWRYQPARQSRSWGICLLEHRRRMPRRLRPAP